jgi:hypothetical protein
LRVMPRPGPPPANPLNTEGERSPHGDGTTPTLADGLAADLRLPLHTRATDRAEHLRSGASDPRRARRGRVPPPWQPLGLPALRRRVLLTLRPRLHRHVCTRQRRPLPLPPRVRPQSLPRPARLPREARDRRPTPTHRHLPQRTHPRRPRHRPAQAERERPVLDEGRQAIAAEITRTEHSTARYFDAFEEGRLSPERYEQRLADLTTRLEDLHANKPS